MCDSRVGWFYFSVRIVLLMLACRLYTETSVQAAICSWVQCSGTKSVICFVSLYLNAACCVHSNAFIVFCLQSSSEFLVILYKITNALNGQRVYLFYLNHLAFLRVGLLECKRSYGCSEYFS